MSESLKFADGTTVPIIALYHRDDVNFKGAYRNQIVARIAESATTSAALEALAFDATKTAAIIHTYDQTSLSAEGKPVMGADGKPLTTQKTQEYDNYVIPHHVSHEYNDGDNAYEYYLALCQKTDAELQNAALKSQLAASLEG